MLNAHKGTGLSEASSGLGIPRCVRHGFRGEKRTRFQVGGLPHSTPGTITSSEEPSQAKHRGSRQHDHQRESRRGATLERADPLEATNRKDTSALCIAEGC